MVERAKTAAPSAASVNYAEVAEVVRELRAAGRPVRKGLAEHFDRPETTVANWLSTLRKRGLDVGAPAAPAAKPDLAERTIGFTLDDARAAIEAP